MKVWLEDRSTAMLFNNIGPNSVLCEQRIVLCPHNNCLGKKEHCRQSNRHIIIIVRHGWLQFVNRIGNGKDILHIFPFWPIRQQNRLFRFNYRLVWLDAKCMRKSAVECCRTYKFWRCANVSPHFAPHFLAKRSHTWCHKMSECKKCMCFALDRTHPDRLGSSAIWARCVVDHPQCFLRRQAQESFLLIARSYARLFWFVSFVALLVAWQFLNKIGTTNVNSR
jgi:hypothetical protein